MYTHKCLLYLKIHKYALIPQFPKVIIFFRRIPPLNFSYRNHSQNLSSTISSFNFLSGLKTKKQRQNNKLVKQGHYIFFLMVIIFSLIFYSFPVHFFVTHFYGLFLKNSIFLSQKQYSFLLHLHLIDWHNHHWYFNDLITITSVTGTNRFMINTIDCCWASNPAAESGNKLPVARVHQTWPHSDCRRGNEEYRLSSLGQPVRCQENCFSLG